MASVDIQNLQEMLKEITSVAETQQKKVNQIIEEHEKFERSFFKRFLNKHK